MWRRVCKEAGGRLQSGFLRNLDLGNVLPTDDRRLECVVDGLNHHGAQYAVDTTLVCPLTRKGQARPRAHRENGAAMADARKRKERRYPELVEGTRCQLVVTAMEVGGRWSAEAYDFLQNLAYTAANDAPPALRGSTYQAWKRRWAAMLSVAGMRAFADTLLHGTAADTAVVAGREPTLGQLLGDEPHEEGSTRQQTSLHSAHIIGLDVSRAIPRPFGPTRRPAARHAPLP